MGFITHKNEKGGVLLVLVNIQDDMIELQKLGLLDKLLVDKTTRRHILWGTNAYREYGERYAKYCEIFVTLVLFNNLDVIKTRARRNFEQQVGRTKLHGEVATPLWVCNKMIDAIDCDWLGMEHLPENAWQQVDTLFQQTKKSWKKYVDNKRLEIACGEAPYLIQRYDGTNGTMIPVEERTGILDRKLHVVSAYATTQEEWIHWAIRAVEATFGYEYQGDNLLIARVNVIKTFIEFYIHKWNEIPYIKLLKQLLTKITWNLWQMDGLTDTIPCNMDSIEEVSLFDEQTIKMNSQPRCKVYDWRNLKKSILFAAMKGRQTGMKFDYVIGNPPYQDESNGKMRNYAPPIYNLFLDAAYSVANSVELIHPARFLFDAGSTPKEWNHKMLNDPHLKILYYESDSTKVFVNTDIKGGIAITYHDTRKTFGAIEIFTPYPKINTVLQKVKQRKDFKSLSNIVYSRTSYRLTDLMHRDYPDALNKLSKGHAYDMSSNIFQRLPEIFFDKKPNDGKEYIQILGRENNLRVYKYIRRDYVNNPINLQSYKIYVAQANGSGAFGETLSSIIIGKKNIGSTETFISIGNFNEEKFALNLKKYLQTKFARAMLSILKVTQNGNKPVWRMVPLQNFSEKSDIDWSQSISDIDQQLYKKYKLTQEEINFIEKNVKEMK